MRSRAVKIIASVAMGTLERVEGSLVYVIVRQQGNPSLTT
jgi:hypothetical protein